MPWRILVVLAVALALAWTLLVVVLLVARPRGGKLKEAVRLLPDTARLLRRMAVDREVPRGVRLRLWLLLLYLAMPIDVIPDFIPVIGYADDAILIVLVLRSAIRRAGPEVLRKHWPGSEEGLEALRRLAGL